MTPLYLLFGLTALAAAALHILSVFSKKGSKIFAYVNIALHLALIAEALFLGFSLEVLSLVMMSSLLFYLFISYLKFLLDKKTREVEK